MAKLIRISLDKVFPCLDLYRIFLTHPDSANHFKKFEDGLTYVFGMASILNDKASSDPTKMLALRCLANMFND
jgi:PUL domain